MKKSHSLTAAEAAAQLGISLSTLYAYVSRGMIHSEAGGDDPRSRRYNAEDIERLKTRKESRHHPEIAAQSALHLGMPVLESAITLIDNGRLYYRGHDAVELAQSATVEQVAALIWTGDLNKDTFAWLTASLDLPPIYDAINRAMGVVSAFERFQVALPLAGQQDFTAYDVRPSAVASTGLRILKLLTILAASKPFETGLAETLAAGWGMDDAQTVRLISAALILCADHELNVSAFTVRCVASANATPYAAVIAGLAALGGSKHGGHTERVEAFLREAGSPEGVYEAMASRLRRGEPIPGFGHVLYPDGDPRGRSLLSMIAAAYPDASAVAMTQALQAGGIALLGDYPTIDLALVILARALDLPRGAPLGLFGIGRTIGWIGHAIEQYALDQLIRPRARYIGATPNVNLT
jgi:citrate synthase